MVNAFVSRRLRLFLVFAPLVRFWGGMPSFVTNARIEASMRVLRAIRRLLFKRLPFTGESGTWNGICAVRRLAAGRQMAVG